MYVYLQNTSLCKPEWFGTDLGHDVHPEQYARTKTSKLQYRPGYATRRIVLWAIRYGSWGSRHEMYNLIIAAMFVSKQNRPVRTAVHNVTALKQQMVGRLAIRTKYRNGRRDAKKTSCSANTQGLTGSEKSKVDVQRNDSTGKTKCRSLCRWQYGSSRTKWTSLTADESQVGWKATKLCISSWNRFRQPAATNNSFYSLNDTDCLTLRARELCGLQ